MFQKVVFRSNERNKNSHIGLGDFLSFFFSGKKVLKFSDNYRFKIIDIIAFMNVLCSF